MFKNGNKAYVDIDDKPTPTSSSQVCLLGLSFGDPAATYFIFRHSRFNVIHVHCQVTANPTFPSSLGLKKFI